MKGISLHPVFSGVLDIDASYGTSIVAEGQPLQFVVTIRVIVDLGHMAELETFNTGPSRYGIPRSKLVEPFFLLTRKLNCDEPIIVLLLPYNLQG